MGPSRTRDAHLLAQRGRFHEGSMRDRASAAPPLQFLDPSERVLMVPFCTTGMGTGAGTDAAAVGGLGGGGRGAAEEKRASSKMKTNIFGQMWEGVRGRLRIRRDADKDKGEGDNDDDDDDDEEQRPTRDQVLANYHQLVASGFFSAHAIQSTRHGPPPPRPCTSRGPPPPPPPPPQWPLAPAVPVPAMMPDDDDGDDDGDDKKMAGPATPRAEMCSPASAASSARGTKRAAAEPPTGEEEGDGEGDGEGEADRDDEGEDEATRAHRFLPKRLRRTDPRDRDIISLPRLRGVASRNKGGHHVPAQAPRARRGPTDHDDMASSLGRKIKHPARGRNSRTRAAAGDSGRAGMEAEPLSVVPDANRGIPRLPAIPAKFTCGEDGRENGGSTR